MICLGFVLACTVAQLYRYRYVSTAIQRQQTKWIMFDMLLGTFVDAANLLPLPGAVEVAAYRIMQEALNNVVRHAGARQCHLRLGLHDRVLTLQVSDDGRGIAPGYHIGVGLLAMQARAVELGGSCTITGGETGGTTIDVRLPLEVAAAGTL